MDKNMDANKFLQGRTRETTIVRDSQGRWFHDGQPLVHPNLVKSFDRWVERAADGRYCLKNDINWAYITLEGPPYFVRSVQLESDGVRLRLSNDALVPLRGETLRQDADGALYCDVLGDLTARFDNAAATQLESLLGEDERGVYLTLAGARHYPPVVAQPLSPSQA